MSRKAAKNPRVGDKRISIRAPQVRRAVRVGSQRVNLSPVQAARLRELVTTNPLTPAQFRRWAGLKQAAARRARVRTSDVHRSWSRGIGRGAVGQLQQAAARLTRVSSSARARNPRKARKMAKRKRNRLGHFIKSAHRSVRRARDRLGHFIATSKPRRRKKSRAKSRRAVRRKNPATGATMSRALVANPRKRRGRKHRATTTRRRRTRSGRFASRRTTSNPRRRRTHRRHYRRNPMGSGFMKSAMSSLLPMGLGGIGGALSGFADAKFMSDKPVVSAISKVVLGAAGCALLRKRPAMAFGWAGGVMGSFGYSMGVKAAGGLVAHSPTAALKGIADMASDDPEMAALLEGLGDLQPDDSMGDADEYASALADSDESDGVGDLVEAD